MRILVIGDQHFRNELPYNTALSDGRRGEWESVKSLIHKTAKDCDAVVLLGDNFNARHNHSSVIREFVEFLKGFGDKEVHILVGNHERYDKSTALDFIQRLDHKNRTVYNEPKLVDIAGVSTMMIPFIKPAQLGCETREEALTKLVSMFPPSAKLALAHHAIAGSNVNNAPMDMATDFFNEIVLDKDTMMEHFDITMAGHVHQKQQLNKRVIITGNIFTHEVGEHEKSIWIYSDGDVIEVPLPVRPIHKITWENPDRSGVIPSNSIVKCYVTERETDIEKVKTFLSQFDASVVIEKYPSEREKTHFETGTMDLSIDGLLKIFAEARGFPYQDVLEGFQLIKT